MNSFKIEVEVNLDLFSFQIVGNDQKLYKVLAGATGHHIQHYKESKLSGLQPQNTNNMYLHDPGLKNTSRYPLVM